MAELKEMSKDEFLEEIKNACNRELMTLNNDTDVVDEEINIDEDDLVELETTILKEKAKAERIGKKLARLKAEKARIEIANKDNPILAEYIRTLEAIEKAEAETKTMQDTLYASLNNYPQELVKNVNLSSEILKIVYKKAYFREDFNVARFKEDYQPTTDMYKRYIGQKLIKGNVKITLKG